MRSHTPLAQPSPPHLTPQTEAPPPRAPRAEGAAAILAQVGATVGVGGAARAFGARGNEVCRGWWKEGGSGEGRGREGFRGKATVVDVVATAVDAIEAAASEGEETGVAVAKEEGGGGVGEVEEEEEEGEEEKRREM